MADTKISQYPAAASVVGSDEFVKNEAGVTKKATAEQIGGYVNAISIVAADVSSTDAVNWADITGLTFSVKAGKNYSFEATLFLTSALTTTAPQLSVNGPAAPTNLRYAILQATSATAVHQATQTAYDTNTNPQTGPGATVLMAFISGMITPSVDGTLAFRLRSEVAASAVTVKANSFARVMLGA